MKKHLKVLSLLLAAILVAAAFVSCASKPADTTTSGQDSTSEKTESDTSDTAGEQTVEDTGSQTEDVTTEEVTTEEETEPVELKLYDVYRWDFDNASDLGWLASNNTTVTATEDGYMKLEVKGTDPNITTKKLKSKVDCEKVEYIVMRVKNATDSGTGQLFISTSDSPGPNESYSTKYDYSYFMDDDEWEEIVIDTIDINGWSGNLISLRLDYSEGSEGECYIDYIALQTTDERNAGSADVETEADPRAGKELLYTFDLSKLTADDIYLSSKKSDDEDNLEVDGDAGDDPRWMFSKGIEDAYVEDGHLVIKVGGQDPYFASPTLTEPFDCSAVSAIVFKICNKTDMYLGQFFFISDGSSYSEAGSVKLNYEKAGADNEEWEEIVINPNDSPIWAGQLEKIRFDPTEAWDGVFWIESIQLYGN